MDDGKLTRVFTVPVFFTESQVDGTSIYAGGVPFVKTQQSSKTHEPHERAVSPSPGPGQRGSCFSVSE